MGVDKPVQLLRAGGARPEVPVAASVDSLCDSEVLSARGNCSGRTRDMGDSLLPRCWTTGGSNTSCHLLGLQWSSSQIFGASQELLQGVLPVTWPELQALQDSNILPQVLCFRTGCCLHMCLEIWSCLLQAASGVPHMDSILATSHHTSHRPRPDVWPLSALEKRCPGVFAAAHGSCRHMALQSKGVACVLQHAKEAYIFFFPFCYHCLPAGQRAAAWCRQLMASCLCCTSVWVKAECLTGRWSLSCSTLNHT